GPGTTVNVTGRNDTISISGGTVAVGVGSAVTLSGASDTINVGSTANTNSSVTTTVIATDVSGTDRFNVYGSGNRVVVSNATLTLADNAEAVIIGLNNTIVAGAHAHITLIGNGDRVTVADPGTNPATLVDVAGNNNTVTMNRGEVVVELGSVVTVNGANN